MNLKRHHVLYGLLAMSLIIALIVLFIPASPEVSDTTRTASSTPSRTSQASSTISEIHFEVVTTVAAQERGLGGRTEVPENYAMLFVFPQDERVGFWMKDMLVPIDILWLSDAGKILGIEDSVSPATYPEAFYPPRPVKYVLEMRAGETRRRGWTTDTTVTLPLPYGR